MIAICFFWGIWEWKKPKDPGPLFIDLDRKIKNKTQKTRSNVGTDPAQGVHTGSDQSEMKEDSHKFEQTFNTSETVRVTGNLRIPKDNVIPYSMVVEGDLISEENVIFKGGLHVKGCAVIGARNRLEKSIVCQKELILFEDVIVYNCVDCEGLVFIKSGVRIGAGEEGGAVAAARTIFLENAKGPLEIHSEECVRVIGVSTKAIPEELRKLLG